MRLPSSFSEQRGYFTFVQNTATVDYLSLALLQAKSIKQTQTIDRYAVALDAGTKELLTDEHRRYFDYIIDIPNDASIDQAWKLANEWKCWWLTPFKETVKLDCDIIFTRDVSHWWDTMSTKEIFIATTAYTYTSEVATSRHYRRLIDDNGLIDAYSGFTYFRFGLKSHEFFSTVRHIFQNWDFYRDQVLKNCRQNQATTDEAYALAAKIVGEEECYIPGSQVGFVHMKPVVQSLSATTSWDRQLYCQLDGAKLSIGFHTQQYPVHYVDKQVGLRLLEEYDTI